MGLCAARRARRLIRATGLGAGHPGVARGGGLKARAERCPLCQASPSPRPLRVLRPRLPPPGTRGRRGGRSCPRLGTAGSSPGQGQRGHRTVPRLGGWDTDLLGPPWLPRGWVLGGVLMLAGAHRRAGDRAMCPLTPSPGPGLPTGAVGAELGAPGWVAASGHRSAPCLSFPSCPGLPGTLLGAGAPLRGTTTTGRSQIPGSTSPGHLGTPGHGVPPDGAELAWDYANPCSGSAGAGGVTGAGTEGTTRGHSGWHRGVPREWCPALVGAAGGGVPSTGWGWPGGGRSPGKSR